MPLDALIARRHSCRAFRSDVVPDHMITRMLELARRAPSDCNSQAWHLTVFGGGKLEALRTDLYQAAKDGAPRVSDIPPIAEYSGAYQQRRRACGWALYESVGIAKGDRSASAQQALENFRFFGAPHFALLSTAADLGERGLFDSGIYLGHLLLAAEALGIATIAQGAVAHHTDVLRRHSGLGHDRRIICGISFGYALAEHPANSFRTDRAELSETVTILT